MLELQGRNVLVTGGSRGIGRAICVALAQMGARIAVHYHSAEEKAQETLELLSGEGHFIVQADISRADECERLTNVAIERMERMHVLVNNAGIYEHLRFDSTNYAAWQAEWQRMISTNLLSSVNLSYLFVRHYLEHGGGKIINIASRAGFKGERQASHYGASKAAQINLTRSMANELATTGILVYAVAPGWVETEMTTEYLQREHDRIIADIPLRRVAQSEDVANAVAFLASDKANYLNGATIDVNGGSYFH